MGPSGHLNEAGAWRVDGMVPTRDHNLIREWAKRFDAFPAQVRRLKHNGEPAVLTFTFGEPEENAKPHIQSISWEMFFAEFDLMKLSMAWDDHTHDFVIVKVERPSAASPSVH